MYVRSAVADVETLGGRLFDVDHYLLQRQTHPDFVMAEIGHRYWPVAPLVGNFCGKRAYIGLEACLREDIDEMIPGMARARMESGPNVFFITQQLDRCDYQPKTILPCRTVKEVFASNVFGDPQVSTPPPPRRPNGSSKTEKLLAEAARIVDDNGVIVVRETITPDSAKLSPRVIEAAGLAVLAKVRVIDDERMWLVLEEQFDGSEGQTEYDELDSFYLFLGRAAAL